MGDSLIRLAKQYDLDKIVELWYEMSVFHEKIDSYFQLSSDCKRRYQEILFQHINNSESAIFVYERNQNLLGYIFIKIELRASVFATRRTGFIQELSVTEKERRLGIGQQLLTVAMKWFENQSIAEVSCHFSPQNSYSSEFWKKNGFSPKLTTATYFYMK
ncbi:MAG: GNAT family N-acetyltransferase [Bdellovibrionales bacterium]|nr:GNAT family N-acetyltransferase [Bdellovibrionales bacterium]